MIGKNCTVLLEKSADLELFISVWFSMLVTSAIRIIYDL